ncbi:Phosphoserine phosphatase RsbP [Bremerella volcania]|uniref:Phosphoserine phosphatase RsbP n=1 Tax=Bremerella volcania TaxID=2527984 RepID=A0A518CG73_9BACT|nr:PP2C family protein-serine/threonine phosphatase [Bremerella volcania]QDU78230.1 Phosphoserine phosphatase RsbP [Bremerella volcania]
MRTHLGDVRIFDQSAVVEVRSKVLSLTAAFGFGSAMSTRMATILSDLVRQLLKNSEPGSMFVDLEDMQGQLILGLRFLTSETIQISPALHDVFDDVRQLANGDAVREISLRKMIRNMPGSLTPEFLDFQRDRISLKSRAALLEELREKNQQLERYNAHLEDLVRERTNELELTNQRMQRDLDAGAEYVARLIPEPITGQISIDWRYVPSEELGGDAMGYHWIDPDHMAIYLLDVTGHGIDSALLAVSIINVVRGASLPGADFRNPSEVLKRLNQSFTMDMHGNKLYTMWYGVFHRPSRTLTWGGGGHPDALLYVKDSREPIRLASQGPLMGMIEWPHFETDSIVIESPSSMFLYSDGVFEIHKEDGNEWTFEEFVDFMNQPVPKGDTKMDDLYRYVRELCGCEHLGDDFSILELRFNLRDEHFDGVHGAGAAI